MGTQLSPHPQTKKEGAKPPSIFGPCLLWPNGWMDQDATWYRGMLEGRPRPRPHCVRWGLTSALRRGTTSQFSVHVYCVAKRLDGSGCHSVWRYRPQPRPHCVRWRPSSSSRSRSLYAVARPSVVCLSVTRVRPIQAVEIFGNISTVFGTLAIP